jgi:rhodanese-related sulfurtransferase
LTSFFGADAATSVLLDAWGMSAAILCALFYPPGLRGQDPVRMNRLTDYLVHHPYLVTATAAVAVAAAGMELRMRARGSQAIGAVDAVRLVNGGALALDVRTGDEFAAGHIIDARNMPAADLAKSTDSLKKYREKPVIVYCDNGVASAAAARTLKDQGFAKVVTLRGGLNGWRQENFPVVKPAVKGK